MTNLNYKLKAIKNIKADTAWKFGVLENLRSKSENFHQNLTNNSPKEKSSFYNFATRSMFYRSLLAFGFVGVIVGLFFSSSFSINTNDYRYLQGDELENFIEKSLLHPIKLSSVQSIGSATFSTKMESSARVSQEAFSPNSPQFLNTARENQLVYSKISETFFENNCLPFSTALSRELEYYQYSESRRNITMQVDTYTNSGISTYSFHSPTEDLKFMGGDYIGKILKQNVVGDQEFDFLDNDESISGSDSDLLKMVFGEDVRVYFTQDTQNKDAIVIESYNFTQCLDSGKTSRKISRPDFWNGESTIIEPSNATQGENKLIHIYWFDPITFKNYQVQTYLNLVMDSNLIYVQNMISTSITDSNYNEAYNKIYSTMPNIRVEERKLSDLYSIIDQTEIDKFRFDYINSNNFKILTSDLEIYTTYLETPLPQEIGSSADIFAVFYKDRAFFSPDKFGDFLQKNLLNPFTYDSVVDSKDSLLTFNLDLNYEKINDIPKSYTKLEGDIYKSSFSDFEIINQIINEPVIYKYDGVTKNIKIGNIEYEFTVYQFETKMENMAYFGEDGGISIAQCEDNLCIQKHTVAFLNHLDHKIVLKPSLVESTQSNFLATEKSFIEFDQNLVDELSLRFVHSNSELLRFLGQF